MRKPQAPAPGEVVAARFPDETWVKSFPFLVEMLVSPCYDDGEMRELSTVTVKWQDNAVLVSVQDHDLSRGLYRVSGSFLGALRAVEKALAEGTADWRAWKVPKGKGKKS
jgi:hypothetical protein